MILDPRYGILRPCSRQVTHHFSHEFCDWVLPRCAAVTPPGGTCLRRGCCRRPLLGSGGSRSLCGAVGSCLWLTVHSHGLCLP